MGLIEKYNLLLSKYSFVRKHNVNIVNEIIRDSLVRFVSECKNPAIWCYGEHTRNLMAEYIFEMRKIKYIVDKNYKNMGESGYHIIGDHQIKDCEIDGIIISTYEYREEIKAIIDRNYPEIPYLDFYEELEKKGIVLENGYYKHDGPYDKYIKINQLKKERRKNIGLEKIYMDIINEYINMMDFQSAIDCVQELQKINDTSLYRELKRDIVEIYQLELATIAGMSQNNVFMFCIDGLRRRDVLGNDMPNIKKYLAEHTRFYTNAYSISTSTYESLIPAYSENNDMRTRYYETNLVEEKDCRFITEAIKQGRNIYFYTDSAKYVESEKIKYTYMSQTATEKMWNFAVDAETEENGLFYVHVLWESHFSFPNPDTEAELVVNGNGMLEDYFERNGGKIQADYVQQHADAIRYLDRVLSPFLERIPCRFVLYADHGNQLIPLGTPLEAIETIEFTCSMEETQVPLAIKSPETGKGTSDSLISLMSLNEMIYSLLKKERFVESENEFVKIQRSVRYNPEARLLYQKVGMEQELEAFEAFVFEDDRKLVVYGNGVIKLWDENEKLVEDQSEKDRLFRKIRDYITVTDCI